jgi:hypothetical protein
MNTVAYLCNVKGKVSNPFTGGNRLLEFLGGQNLKVARLSDLHTGHLYQPWRYSCYSLLLVAGWSEGLSQQKIQMTPSGIEPGTHWAVAHCQNQLPHLVPIQCQMFFFLNVCYMKGKDHLEDMSMVGRLKLE